MTTPPCGHTDGWCGGPVNCTRDVRPTPEPPPFDEEAAYERRHGREPEWRTR